MAGEGRQVPRFRFIDLFAGVGGFHHALGSPDFGGECILAVEIDDACQAVYRAAFPNTDVCGDIRSITQLPGGADRPLEQIDGLVPDHEVLCAGFPCQPFSKSGFQKGVQDQTRGTLFFDILQIIRAKHPQFLILENVRNLAGPRHRDTWKTIVSSLRVEGYQVADDPVVFSPHLLPPGSQGAPQVRDRVFVLAQYMGSGVDGETLVTDPLVAYRSPKGWRPDDWKISEWLDKDSDISDLKKYQLRPEEIGWIDAWNALSRDVPGDWLPGFPIWADEFNLDPLISSDTPKWKADFLRKNAYFYEINQTLIDEWKTRRFGPLGQRVDEFPPSRRKFEWQARKSQPTRESRNLWELVIHLRPSGIRVKPASYLPALVAITQTSVIGERRRRITPREAAKLQGLPYSPFFVAGLEDAAIYRQLGNAVSVGAVGWVARALFSSAGMTWGGSPETVDLEAVDSLQREPAILG